jgi:hypothetical protein
MRRLPLYRCPLILRGRAGPNARQWDVDKGRAGFARCVTANGHGNVARGHDGSRKRLPALTPQSRRVDAGGCQKPQSPKMRRPLEGRSYCPLISIMISFLRMNGSVHGAL